MPKNRKVIKSDKSIKAYKPESKPYLVAISNHPKLFLRVRSNGTKSWIYRYKHPISKKTVKISFGIYPNTSLKRACEMWRYNEDLLSQQIDPQTYRDEQKQLALEKHSNTFADISAEWQTWQSDVKKVSKSTQVGNERYLSYARSEFGDKPICEVTAPMILSVCKKWEMKGNHETANRIKLKCSQVFRYAGSHGKCQHDPTSLLKGALVTPIRKHHPSITEPSEFGKLLRDIETLRAGSDVINSLKLLALLYPRNGDLRYAKWSDFNFNDALWTLKPQKGAGRRDMMKEIYIPLPNQAISILEEQFKLTGHTRHVFYSSQAIKEHVISENTAGKALNNAGYQGLHCPHGFRASAKTMLMERLEYNDLLTELQLAHQVKDIHGTAYNRVAFLNERRKMAQVWANYLDELRN